MGRVTYPVDVDQETRKICFFVIFDYDGLAAQDPVAVLNSSEAVVDVPHVPVKVFRILKAVYMGTEAVQHLPLKRIIMLINFIERNALLFSNLVNRE